MPSIGHVLRGEKEIGWIPCDHFETGWLKIQVPSMSEITQLIDKYRIDKWVNVSKEANDDTKPGLRHKRQQRMVQQDKYEKDPNVEQLPLALELAERYVLDWKEFYDDQPVSKEQWQNLPENQKYPKPENVPIDTKHYFKRQEVPFSKDVFRQVVEVYLVVWLVGKMLNQAELLAEVKKSQFEEEVKN